MLWKYWYFLAAGILLATYYRLRETSFAKLRSRDFPELSPLEFEALAANLESSNQRMLALAAALFLLGLSPLFSYGPAFDSTVMAVTIALFFYNIPPRNRTMRIICDRGIERKRFRRLGIRL